MTARLGVNGLGRTEHRRSSDSAWPLRGADGLTFAERKRREMERKRANG